MSLQHDVPFPGKANGDSDGEVDTVFSHHAVHPLSVSNTKQQELI